MHATTNTAPPAKRTRGLVSRWIAGLSLGLLLSLAGSGASAAPPPAGTSIGNQASATYTDAAGVNRTVTSNSVQTVVQQVAALTLTAPGTKTASIGSTVYYPHTLTNTGNGTDTFTLAAANAGTGSTFSMSSTAIYADNGSGQPTGPVITSTGALAAGAAFKFIVAASVPATATSGQTNNLTVTGTSTFSGTQTTTNTDTTTVTSNAVIVLTKSVSAASGAPGTGTAYTYTLSYTNTGNNTAKNVQITDQIPTGMTEVAKSGLWNGSIALTDTLATYVSGTSSLTYSYVAPTVSATLATVAPGQSGTISFQVTVAAGTAAGTINNTANVSYNDGSSTTGNNANGTSNTVPFTVTKVGAVSLTAPAAIASAVPGSSISFANVITNKGNSTDTFNVTLAPGATPFPAGTTFLLFKADGVTPLVDTNGDGIPDTGPVAAGASYTVVMKATLPANASGPGPFAESKTATSTVDPTQSATGSDVLTALPPSVNVTNNAPLSNTTPPLPLGTGIGPESTPVVTNSVGAGTTTAFVLYINNLGSNSDSYNLSSTLTAPTGWSVTFKADGGTQTCSTTTGAALTTTAAITGGASALVCAVVTVPAGAAAGSVDFNFRAQSGTTGVQDTINDAVTVNSVARSLTITPNNAGQASAGGTVIYSHTITNTGTVTEGALGGGSTMTLSNANTQPGWTAVQYYDINNTGVFAANDPVIPAAGLQGVLPGGLAAGKSITIFDVVQAPAGVANGVVNTTTLTLTTTNNTYTSTVPATVSVTDATTVVAGNLTLSKTQGLDAACTGTPTGGYSGSAVSALPGACIDYQITVQNVGSTNATAVTVSDATPAFTLMSATPTPTTTVGTITAPTAGTAGTVSATIGTLTPGQSAVVTFGVKIQQ